MPKLVLSFKKPVELYTREQIEAVLKMQEQQRSGVAESKLIVNQAFGNKDIHKYTEIEIHQADPDDRWLHGHMNCRDNPKIDLRDGLVYYKTKENWIAQVPRKQLKQIHNKIRQKKPELFEEGFKKAGNI